MNDAPRFLKALYPDGIPDGFWLLTWSDKDKLSNWWHELPTEYVWEEDRNIYIGCGLSPKSFGQNRRCSAAQIAAIPGVWADIDFGSEGHKKENLPPDEAAAIELVKSLPVEPTLIVHSGGGLQPWWLFNEPFVFGEDKGKGADRQTASTLVTNVQAALRQIASRKGWDVDSTKDLSRVMRLPGTVNVKGAAPRPVQLMADSGPRWPNAQALADAWGVDIAVSAAGAVRDAEPKEAAALPEGPVDARRQALLWSVDPEALAAWTGQPIGTQDKSESARDMAVANRAALVGWSREEIAALLVQGRRLRGVDLKHPGYYDLTVTKAIESAVKRSAAAQAEEALHLPVSEGGRAPTTTERLEAVSKVLGISPPIERITVTRSDPAQYTLHWNGQTVDLGDSGGLLDHRRFQRKVLDMTRVVINDFKRQQWRPVVQTLADCVEIVEVGDLATLRQQVEAWADEYLAAIPPATDEGDWQVAAQMRSPFVLEDVTYISTRHLATWIWSWSQERIPAAKLAGALALLGWFHERKTVRVGESVFARHVWGKRNG